jgi:phosphatidylinositol 4-phosphatase
MKQFFKLAGAPGPKQTTSKPTPPTPVKPAHLGPLPNRTGLDPKYTVPPVPHPIPYQHLDISVSSQGLLLKPHIPGFSRTESYVRISWGLAGKVELVENAASRDPELDWSKGVVVYGILGSLDLFTGM